MSASLSPLEQLEQQSQQAQPAQSSPASVLSPLEQLEQQSQQTTASAPQPQQDPSEIPETSYGAATWGALKNLGSDTVNAVKGAAGAINPSPQDAHEKDIQQGIGGTGAMLMYRMAKSLGAGAIQAHDIPAAIHDINKSADPMGTYAKILQKTASQGAGQAVTAIAADGASKVPSVVSDIAQGEKAAQAPAQAALRSGASASAADAGVDAGAQSGGMRTVLDDAIGKVSKQERGLYDTLNKASGTDLKTLYDHSSDVQEALDDPTNIANRTALQKELQATQDSIAKGESQAAANGVDPNTLTTAKAATQQRYAMETVKQKLFNNESVVNGNAEHGAPETINVKSAIRQVEGLDKPSRYAPEGTPSRLEQAFGAEGAANLKQGLYDAQKAGVSAATKKNVAKWVGGGALSIAGYEGAKKLLPK